MYLGSKALCEKYYKRYHIDEWFSYNIQPHIELHIYEKGDFICCEDGFPSHLFFLVEGRTKIYTTHSNGKVSLIEFNSPLTLFGEMEFVGTRKTSIPVQAMEKCICIAVRLEQCRNLLLNDATFLFHLSKYLADRTIKNARNFVSNQAHSLEERLCNFILTAETNGVFSVKLAEASEFLGVSYRHMQRAIANLCNQNVLSRSKEGYVIQDYPYLQEHSKTSSSI